MDLEKELHVTGNYAYFSEYYPDNHKLELMLAIRVAVRIGYSSPEPPDEGTKQAGFPTRKKL